MLDGRWLIMVWVGRFWLILWVWWFVVMFGDAVVVVWYGFLSDSRWFVVMFGDAVVVVWYGFLSDSRWFAMRMVVDLGVLMGL